MLARYVETGAQSDSAPAKNALGEMCLNGEGMEQDLVRAVQLFQQAADSENAEGARNLAELYKKGIGVTQDKDKARQLLRLAQRWARTSWGCNTEY